MFEIYTQQCWRNFNDWWDVKSNATTEVQCKIGFTLHQWSHPRWGTLLPCCQVNTSAPRFSCRTRAAISHVPALVPTICFDHSLMVFMTLWQQHSLPMSCTEQEVLVWYDSMVHACPACTPSYDRATNTHSAHSGASFPLASYRSLRTKTSRHKKSFFPISLLKGW